MKYVVMMVLDQTVGFLDANDVETIRHPEALLHETREAADAKAHAYDAQLPTHGSDGKPHSESLRARWMAWVEEVPDEAEFRAREDTW
jgi:hypothetical protein